VATYLVTGGAGFIGSHIVDELTRLGQRVRVLDNLSTGRRENLEQANAHIEFIEGDVRDLATVVGTMQDVDYVLHQAALASVPRSVADPLAAHQVNATGTLNVLMAARDARVERVVYASSSSVYGDSPTLPKHEEMPTNPLSPYAVSKLAGENYCQAFYRVYGLPTVALRYFNVFGPRQDPASQYAAVIPRFITTAMLGDALTIYGDGRQSRDFTYVSDVVAANLLACRPSAAPAIGQVMNVSCGQRHSLLDLVGRLEHAAGWGPLTVRHDEPRPGDVKHSQANIARARDVLRYAPLVDLEAGLEKTVEWYARQ